MSELIWWIFASVAVGGGLMMVAAKNPVASLLFLVLSFFSLAAIYVVLEAHFIAAIQVIVYAGAIMVLFLFAIMLLNLGEQYQRDMRAGVWVIAGSALTGAMAYVLARTLGVTGGVEAGGTAMIDTAVRESNVVGAIAIPMMRQYVVAFEVTAVLLLVATIGAVLLAKRRV